MSQQRVALVAVCVLGAVALVSAQSFDFNSCQQSMRRSIDEYTRSLRSAGQKFASNLQSTADSSMDMSAFQGDLDNMMNSFNELAQQGTNFDASKLANAYTSNVNNMMGLMRTAFRMYMKMPQGAMTSYMEFGQSIMSSQSKLMQSMTSACMPKTKSESSQ